MGEVHKKSMVYVANGLRIYAIPKNASTTIHNIFTTVPHSNTSPEDKTEGYRVAVIRHPCDRLLSCWSHFCTRDNWEYLPLKQLGMGMGVSFDEFLAQVFIHYKEDVHIEPQINFTGGYEMDELIPIEGFSGLLSKVFYKFGIQPKIRHINSSTKVVDWKTAYTQEQLTVINNIYADDIDLYTKAIRRI